MKKLSVSVKNGIRDAAAKALFRARITRALLRQPRTEQIVLLYHNPDPEVFERHLEFLAEHYTFAPLPGADDARAPDGKPLLGISFDDGYAGVHLDLRPILRRAGAPATMFVPTSFFDKRFGYEALKLALQKAERAELHYEGRVLPLRTKGERKDAWHELVASLKLLSSDRRDARIDDIIGELGVSDADVRGAYVVSRAQLREMAQDLEIGSHTVSHPNLARIGRTEIERELRESKAELEALTERPCRLFAYPIGRREDYDRDAVEVVRESGYVRAFTAVPTTSPSSQFEYPRIGVGDFDSVETLCLKLSAAWPPLYRLIG